MNYSDIPKAISDPNYQIDICWVDLLHTLKRWEQPGYGLELCPDFQRGHVWTPDQQVAYVEAKLEGRIPLDIIRFNCVGWMRNFEGPFVCVVDGLQRITAAKRFLNDEIRAFGHLCSEIQGHMPYFMSFRVLVNNISSREEVLRWYIQLNTTGTPHSPEEIQRVKNLLEELGA